MSLFARLIGKANLKAAWSDFNPDLRGQPKSALTQYFSAVGAGDHSIVAIKSKVAGEGFTFQSLAETPDDALYSGLADTQHGRIATFDSI